MQVKDEWVLDVSASLVDKTREICERYITTDMLADVSERVQQSIMGELYGMMNKHADGIVGLEVFCFAALFVLAPFFLIWFWSRFRFRFRFSVSLCFCPCVSCTHLFISSSLVFPQDALQQNSTAQASSQQQLNELGTQLAELAEEVQVSALDV